MTIAPENATGAIAAFAMPIVSTVQSVTTDTADTRPAVVENATFAWTNQNSGVLNALHPDLVFDYREALDTAAIARLPELLAQVWAERGFQARFGSYDEVYDQLRGIDKATYWAVIDEACSRLDVDQLVKDARLVDVQRSLYTD